jgi:hypothetical protein
VRAMKQAEAGFTAAAGVVAIRLGEPREQLGSAVWRAENRSATLASFVELARRPDTGSVLYETRSVARGLESAP